MKQYRRGELTFDVIDAGPADGSVVVLLHGFPQLNTSWNAVIDRLTARATDASPPTSAAIRRGPGRRGAGTTACRCSSSRWRQDVVQDCG